MPFFNEALKDQQDRAQSRLGAFVFAARKDLGDPMPPSIQREVDRLVLPDSGKEDAG